MAVDNTALRVTELDFDQIKTNLKDFLRSQPEFTDYDFEGSGMSILLDILAYNTHYMGYYLNMVGNEMFLDTAQLRASILSHAKTINYIPSSRQGALAKLNIKITPSVRENQNTSFLTLDKYTRLFSIDKDGINYPFVTLYSNTATKSNGSFDFSNITIKQGEVVTIQYLMDATNLNRRFEIPSQNVDTTTLIVNVQESTSNTETVNYTLAQDITELSGNSKVYFLEENENLKYSLQFGDDVIGKKPKNGNIINVTYLENLGQECNNISNFVFSEPIAGEFSDNIVVTTVQNSRAGQEKETIEEIRFRAPYFYTTQNRAVTKYDYQTLIKKDYDFIDYVTVWGGEDNDPIVYGKVFISVKTKGNYELTNLEKERLKNEITTQRGVLTVIPEILDPDYIYFVIKGKVYYNSRTTSLTAGELSTRVRAAILDYSTNELNTFDSVFRRTKLENYIEKCDPSITSCDIKIYVQKRIKVDPGILKKYRFTFNLPVQPNDQDRFSSYPTVQIYDGLANVRDVYYEEDPRLNTGISEILVSDGGQNYISAPTVVIAGDGSGATAVASVLSGRVTGITITNPGTNYTYASAYLTGGDGSGANISEVRLQSETGTIRSYYNGLNGEKIILQNNVGTIYHPTGTLTLNNVRILGVTENPFYRENYLTFLALLQDSVVYPLRNRVLTIDDTDARSILIDVIAE